ncbi:hypothetical protein CROQUDRAFT_670730 [Cronartium quercuum f. sp. fusiforme G11]|uniref:CxC6 like cysteine cluster associated with KDZ domain-containing protein n=1 Tax=Cronartium quercuum f. sp. fusiforme G11 TaxID=708437 RepID=A0A9P6NNB0_9BASI|nr:hypothetical protein CROQUDRAFT_670730 [Cronartium quercuum f. sp. fusiforme G11]
MDVISLFEKLRHYPSVAKNLHIDELSAFLTLASKFVKENDVGLFDAAPRMWEVLWKILFDDLKHCHFDADEAFRLHSPRKKENNQNLLDIPQLVIFPPYRDQCPTPTCDAHTSKLKRHLLIVAYLYDLDGIRSVHHYTMYCERNVSVYNLVNIYNELHHLHDHAPNHFHQQDFLPHVSDHLLQGALDLHLILPHYQKCNLPLNVPMSNKSRPRFEAAKVQVLSWLDLEGSDFIDHICDKCTNVTPINDGEDGCHFYCAIIINGITIGYSCCSASKEQLIYENPSNPDPPPCTNTLIKVKDHYCAKHTAVFSNMCPCQPCTFPLSPVDPTASLDVQTGNIKDWDALVDTDQSDCVHESNCDGNDPNVDPSGNSPTLGTKPKLNQITVSYA